MVVSPLTFNDLESELSIGSLAVGCERVELGSGAWYELRREWLRGTSSLFDRLLRDSDWVAQERLMYDRMVAVPRLVAHPRDLAVHADDDLRALGERLNAHYAADGDDPFATAALCLYRDGRDSVAWHGDRIGRGATEDVRVAIVSLGAPRPMLLRPRGGGVSSRIDLRSGDLFVMGGSMQRTFDHAIPKSATASGARLSVQFRPVRTL